MSSRFSLFRPARLLCAGAVVAAAFAPATLRAEFLNVPNYSFENPSANTPGFPVNVDLDNWTDTPQRAGFSSPIPWTFGTGNFPNPAVGQSNRLTNMTDDRAAFILTSLELGIYQDLTSTYLVGQSYKLTLGISPEDGTPAGTTLSLVLYYRVGGVITPIASTPVVTYADTNTFIDASVSIPTVQAGNAWANQPIGIMFQVTNVPLVASGPNAGQYDEAGGWDIDNVRLEQVPEPGSAMLAALGLTLFAGYRRARRS